MAPTRTVGVEARVVVVAGGCGGIGSAIAGHFASLGHRVVAVDRRGAPAAGAHDTPHLCPVEFVHTDLTKAPAAHAVATEVERRFGPAQVVVNAVGTFHEFQEAGRMEIDMFTRVLNANVLAAFNTYQAFVGQLRRTGGTLINIGSLTAVTGSWGNVAYATAKGAMDAMTKCLAIEEAAHGVRVNCVVPSNVATPNAEGPAVGLADPSRFESFLRTNQWTGRRVPSAEIASACEFLADPKLTAVTGVFLHITGGAELGTGRKEVPPGVYPECSGPDEVSRSGYA